MAKHLNKVLTRVKESKLTISTIARESGINQRWLYDLMGGKLQCREYERIAELDQYIREHFKQGQALDD